ncbi:ATP-binding protein [Kineococcus sp. SYSU DK005]|uniref:ATP-binding protein n=1 Tax=Kineococcus sp. SYSU DK005 TaxID=3383126 RepID=UPI003D7E961B
MERLDVDHALESPPEEVGRALSALPESQWFERKSARVSPVKLSQAVVALANAEGGTIVVGLHDGRVEGTDADPQHRNELQQVHVQHVQPPARVHTRLLPCRTDDGRDDHLLVVDVSPGDDVHATTRDDVYLRLGDETRRLTYVQRRELFFDRRQAGFESELTTVRLDDADAVDAEAAAQYAARVGHPQWRGLLTARGLARDGRLTIAGLLLFGRHPGSELPNAHVRVTRFAGRERGTGARQQVVSDQRFEGALPRLLADVFEHVRQVQPRRRALGRSGRFEDAPAVPEDAWLEGVVNAVVHRSYSLQSDHVHVDVFDDRVEVESPGRFPGLSDVRDPLSIHRFARNPRIARVCADLDFGQEFGEGIRRMFDEMRLAGLQPPLYQQTEGSVRLTLSTETDGPGGDGRLPEETRLVVAALREAGRLGTRDLAEVMGRTRPTAIRKLTEMREQGVIRWNGQSPRDPRAYWDLPG